jgi:hypothetical protein
MLAHSGCSLLGFAGATALSSGAAGVNYTITNVAYKTMSFPAADVETALNKALIKMDIKKMERTAQEDKISVTVVTANLAIYIDLEKVTPTVTSIEVNAKKGFFLKDKATATEIIVQTEKNLEAKR